MSQLSAAQARVVDPVLTNIARGFKQPNLVGSVLFPTVSVDKRAGKIVEFGREDFKIYETLRSPGANVKRVNFGHAGSAYALDDHSLEGQVPIELMQEAADVPGIELGSSAVRRIQNIFGLRLEKARADLARNTANYAASNKVILSGTSQWSDPASDPLKALNSWREVIRSKIGLYPNSGVLPAAVAIVLQTHPVIKDAFKYTNSDSVSFDMLKAYFGMPGLVMGGSVFTDAADVQQDVWGKDIILAYTEVSGIEDMGSPSFGYTYQLRNYPIVEQPYLDRNTKSWVYPISDANAPVIAGALAGFIAQNAVN